MSVVTPMELLHHHSLMLYQQHQMTLHHHRPEDVPTGGNGGTGWIVPPPGPGAGPTLSPEVKLELQNRKLWQQFHRETTEMIITKLGRRMFPSVQLTVSGLERRARYCLLLEVVPSSRRRHKYVGGGVESGGRGWTSAGPAEPQPRINRRVYLHPDSPATGAHWMQHPVSFGKLKLTNNAVDHHNNVVLTSMHKYVPRIWIIRCDDVTSMSHLYSQPASSFSFPETEFIAVTAYQNENITKLKIDNNPFAKGFRETGQSRCKRKMQHLVADEEHQQDQEHEQEQEQQQQHQHEQDQQQKHQLKQNQQQQQQRQQDDDDGNVSSSESESNRNFTDENASRPKRTASESGSCDDSGVSSSGGVSPPLQVFRNSPQPPAAAHKLHRPWTDDSLNSSSSSSSSSSFSTVAPAAQRPNVGFHPYLNLNLNLNLGPFLPPHHPLTRMQHFSSSSSYYQPCSRPLFTNF